MCASEPEHAFAAAGLGPAPYRLLRVIKADVMGACDFCGTGIRIECWVAAADGREFKVGSDCIKRVGGEGLVEGYKASADRLAHQRGLLAARRDGDFSALCELIAGHAALLRAAPHPHRGTHWKTREPLTLLDHVEWKMKFESRAKVRGLIKWVRGQIAAARAPINNAARGVE